MSQWEKGVSQREGRVPAGGGPLLTSLTVVLAEGGPLVYPLPGSVLFLLFLISCRGV